MNQLQSFINYESTCKKVTRGNQTLYDIKGQHRYLSLTELFNYWKNKH